MSEKGRAKMIKGLGAFLLGVLSFAVFMFVGDTAGVIVTGIVMLAYFFICQFRLSRGNPNALFKDWPIMLALNATIIVVLFVSVLVEKQGAVFLFQALGILLVCFAGTLAGAFVASRAARRKTRQR
jgi:O-antigen/teichoic acid export membrane protein